MLRRYVGVGVVAVASLLASSASAQAQCCEPRYLDDSFGANGMKVLPIEATPYQTHVDSEGRILVAANEVDGGGVLLRFDSEMELDPAFAGDGSVELPHDTEIQVRDDDSIAVLAWDGKAWQGNVISEDGTLGKSATFRVGAPGGVATLTPEGGLWTLWREPSGAQSPEAPYQLVLRRYLPSGLEDPAFTAQTFDGGGQCVLGGPCYSIYVHDLATTADGALAKVVVRIPTHGGATLDYQISSLGLDESEFQDLASIDAQGSVRMDPIRPDSKGGLLASASSARPHPARADFVHILPSGEPDLGFSGGQASLTLPHEHFFRTASSGFGPGESGIYFVTQVEDQENQPIGLKHFLADGTYDEEFEVTAERADFGQEGAESFVPDAVEIDESGRVLAIGVAEFGDTQHLAVARWTSTEGTCEFPELRTPAQLRQVAKDGIAANLVCSRDSTAKLKLRVTRKDAKFFGLKSRTIAGGFGVLPANERTELTADLRFGVARKLAKFRGETVYFKADVKAGTKDGAKLSKLARFGQFTVGGR